MIPEAALACLDRGWVPVRVELRGKKPAAGRGWQLLRPTRADVATWSGNLGVLLGSASGWLVDVDLDCPEALAVARHFLPDTLVFGRASKPSSHWLYIAEGAQSHQFRGQGDEVMLELRGETSNGPGHQTVLPPSVHESGEAIEWSPDHGDGMEEPLRIGAPRLATLCARIARAALFMREGSTLERAIAAELAHRPQARRRATPPPRRSASVDVVERARRYVAAMPASISGSGGHGALWCAALKLISGFGLDEDTALALLEQEFNPRCQPAWRTRDLERKVREVTEKARADRGFLVGAA